MNPTNLKRINSIHNHLVASGKPLQHPYLNSTRIPKQTKSVCTNQSFKVLLLENIQRQKQSYMAKFNIESDIPLPVQQLRSTVLVYAIMNDAIQEYEEITKGYVELVTDYIDNQNQEYHYLEVKDEQTHQIMMRSSVKRDSNFGKQKGTIISWTDDQQVQYQDIALSFAQQQECDIFWRSICEKIGKSYLEINGSEGLEIPTPDNMKQLIDKAKNNVDLVDYNLIHSDSVLTGLRKVFAHFKRENDSLGQYSILRFLNMIFSLSYSTAAIQTLLSGQNFYMVLDLQQLKKGINFHEAYDQKIGSHLKNKFQLPHEIFNSIELSHRATFYRENVLNLAEQAKVQSIMFMICKQTTVKVMGYINRAKVLETVINYPLGKVLEDEEKNQVISRPLSEQEDENENATYFKTTALQKLEQDIHGTSDEKVITNMDKLNFIQELLILYAQISSLHIKNSFKDSLYSSGILQFLKERISGSANIQKQKPTVSLPDNSYVVKSLQILYHVSQVKPQQLFEYFTQSYKQNSTDNLYKTLIKLYTSPPQNNSSVRYLILQLVETFAVNLFNQRPEHFSFFLGTFVYTVFSVASDLRCIIILLNMLMPHLQNGLTQLYQQILKSKVFNKIAVEYRSGSNLKRKAEQLEIIKLLKHFIIEIARQQSSNSLNQNSISSFISKTPKALENIPAVTSTATVTSQSQQQLKQLEMEIVESGFFECCLMIYFKHSMRYNILSSSMLENLKILEKIESFTQFDEYLLKEHSQTEPLQKVIPIIKQKHFYHLQNLKLKEQQKKLRQKQSQYKLFDQQNHQMALENQEQDNYLLNEDEEQDKQYESVVNQSEVVMQKKQQRQDSSPNKNEIEDFQDNLKRIRDQIIFDRESYETLQELQAEKRRNVRKQIKRSAQNSIQTQISFDLPDIQQFEQSHTHQHQQNREQSENVRQNGNNGITIHNDNNHSTHH